MGTRVVPLLTGPEAWTGETLGRATGWIRHVVYHGRTAYEDDPAPGRDRLLYRLWLATPESRALPEGFEVLWGTTAPGALRGGIAQPAAV